MANIAIVNYCNLKCPYCFADDMIQEKTKTIALEDYCKILDFVSRTSKNYIGIIGGEPTLHPQFRDILKETNRYCRECDTGATLFTNGINLQPYLADIGDRIGLLINCNSPDFQPADLYAKHLETLDRLHELSWFDKKATCGCNIHPGVVDYSFFWKLVERYHLDHARVSVVSPAAQYASYRSDKEAYYEYMKPIFIQFCKDAINHNCRVCIDCGHIPMCYFDMEERDIVMSICESYDNDVCHPVVDITSDFRATACFGAYEPVDIRDFDNLIQLEDYLFVKHSIPRIEANCTGKCTTCRKHELLKCQGGCLGFANVSCAGGGC